MMKSRTEHLAVGSSYNYVMCLHVTMYVCTCKHTDCACCHSDCLYLVAQEFIVCKVLVPISKGWLGAYQMLG